MRCCVASWGAAEGPCAAASPPGVRRRVRALLRRQKNERVKAARRMLGWARQAASEVLAQAVCCRRSGRSCSRTRRNSSMSSSALQPPVQLQNGGASVEHCTAPMVLPSSVRWPAGIAQSGTGPSIATVASLPLTANVVRAVHTDTRSPAAHLRA